MFPDRVLDPMLMKTAAIPTIAARVDPELIPNAEIIRSARVVR
jgi:hypothetical protein